MRWRWDQGRLEYFKYDNLVDIARVLLRLEGVELSSSGADPLRADLMAQTGLPFAPADYRVWRNYGRVFACALLATSIEKRLVVTDICRSLLMTGGRAFTIDEYLPFFVRRFAYPFPAFQDYNVHDDQVFPLCAVIKMLLARRTLNAQASIQLEEVFAYVIGNDCTGTESLEHYAALPRTTRKPRGDEQRQVRELLIFCSQLNVLKWFNNTLYLDLDQRDEGAFATLLQLATPEPFDRVPSASAQLIRISTIRGTDSVIVPAHVRESPADLVFTEGRRVRVSHLRAERSPRLRRIFFEARRRPFLCDMCRADLDARYPWTDNMLELHHLLPLSAAIAIDGRGTCLVDVEPVCPNCHKSVHIYYRTYLESQGSEDFISKAQARDVYSEARRAISV